MNDPKAGDRVYRMFANGTKRPAIVVARASVIGGIAHAALIKYEDDGRPRTASVRATEIEKR